MLSSDSAKPAADARPSRPVIDVLTALVAQPTVSSDSNLALIRWVADYLAERGIEAEQLPSSCGGKANLLARIGPDRPGGVVLSGHTDVVPVEGQPWDTDPFSVVERDGRLYGRGTCDMKGFLALGLALVDEMHALERPIYLAFSYDEEIGCLGAPALIQALVERNRAPAAVVVGEPTEMKVVTAHKGIAYLRTQVRGYESHSSLQHLGASAIHAAARLVCWLSEEQATNSSRAVVTANMPEPPYSTLHCGLIEGGTAPNITAGSCAFTTDIRTVPGDDPQHYIDRYRQFAEEQVLPTLQAQHPSTAIDIELLANAPPFQASRDCPAVQLACRLTGQNDTQAQPYAAEAGQFRQAGLPTVMCGPGSIAQAHQPNEFISLAQLAAGERMLRRLIAELSSPRES